MGPLHAYLSLDSKYIPDELYESAHIDGSSAYHDFWHITLSLLRPTIVVVLLLGMINGLKIFDPAYVMTTGRSNNSTQVLAVWMHQQGFTHNQMGYGSVIAVVFLLLCLGISVAELEVGSIHEWEGQMFRTRWYIGTVVIFYFVWVWNNLLYPLVYLTDQSMITIPVGILHFRGTYTTGFGVQCAALAIRTISVPVFYLLFQDKFARGLTADAVKA